MENQLSNFGKYFAGLILILFTTLAIASLIAIWPDKMPDLGKGNNAWYSSTLFQFKLIENKDLNAIDSLNIELDNLRNTIKNADSTKLVSINDNIHKINLIKNTYSLNNLNQSNEKIHLNTILLLLVAVMGFLGNMIHIATSFTTFVGNEEFKRSWLLWYFVKPFTASALSVIIYFIIRAGFLNYGSDASNISIYGILTLAALTGLFTDNATLKLKEIFEVIFKPKDERKDKLNDNSENTKPTPNPLNSVIDINPKKIKKGEETKFTLIGINLLQDNISIHLGDNSIETFTSNTEFSSLIEASNTSTIDFLIIDKNNNKELFKTKIEII